jgi:site-specific DNA recombinase
MRVAIYTRTATRTSGNGQRQLEQCRAFAAARGWQAAEVFADDGASGSNMDRPGLQRILTGMRAGAFDVLLTDAASVLTRNASDLASILADVDAAGVAIMTADGIMDTSTDFGRIMGGLIAKFTAAWDAGRGEEASGATAV